MKKLFILLGALCLGGGLFAQGLTDSQAKVFLKVMEELNALDSNYFESSMEKGLESGGGLTAAVNLMNEKIQAEPEMMQVLKKNNLTWDQWKARSRPVVGGVLYLAFSLPVIQKEWKQLEEKALSVPEEDRVKNEDYMIYRFFMDLEKEFRNTLVLETLRPHLKSFAKAMDLSIPEEDSGTEE